MRQYRGKKTLGLTYNYLTTISFEGATPEGRRLVKCRCKCGTVCIKDLSYVTRGRVKSCGCLQREVAAEIGRNSGGKCTTHGQSHSPEYVAWRSMKQRCYNPKTRMYPRYGGRGIKVCDSWHTFANFFADMGLRPSRKHSIDRIDNNGHYEPNNCRWATMLEQQRNRSSNVPLTLNDITMCASAWDERLGLTKGQVLSRLRKGMDKDDALTKASIPVKERRGKGKKPR